MFFAEQGTCFAEQGMRSQWLRTQIFSKLYIQTGLTSSPQDGAILEKYCMQKGLICFIPERYEPRIYQINPI